jgi:2'-5' RNA ligase
VDHVIAPLDADHAAVVARLSAELAAALALAPDSAARRPHITLSSYTGLDPADAAAAVDPVLAQLAPLVVRAHGYGVFAGDNDNDLSLHVMVVRDRSLDELHDAVDAALCGAGACVAGSTRSSVWTPHVTLLDRGLTARSLGQAVALLACRAHRTWTIRLDSLVVGARRAGPAGRELPFRAHLAACRPRRAGEP